MSIEAVHIGMIRQEVYQIAIDGHLMDVVVNEHIRNIEHELTCIERYLDEREGRQNERTQT